MRRSREKRHAWNVPGAQAVQFAAAGRAPAWPMPQGSHTSHPAAASQNVPAGHGVHAPSAPICSPCLHAEGGGHVYGRGEDRQAAGLVCTKDNRDA